MTLKYDKLLSNIAFKFNLRRYTKGGLKQAFAAYEYNDECHLFELTSNVSAAVASCVRSSDNALTGAANLFQRISAHVLIDFKGPWFFKAGAFTRPLFSST